MKTALIVIDMQNDYLWEKRKPRFHYDTAALVSAVNGLIRRYRDDGQDVIYIRHLIQNLPTNRLLFGYSLAGTEGAALYGGLEVVSELCFDKYVGDALTNQALRQRIAGEGYETLHLCGLDECGCVGATAKGAVKTGARVFMLENCIGRRFPEKKVQKMRNDLKTLGVVYI